MTPSPTAESLYLEGVTDRQCFLDEAHKSAKVTIPALIPDNQDISTRTTPVSLAKPDQSLGSRGVNNLASKLLLTLLPPTAPFMKYELSGNSRDEAEATGVDLSELKSKLARREARIQAEVDLQGLRSKGYQVFRHLLVAGNCLAYVDPVKGGMQVYSLNSYVTKRDGRGNLLDLIYVEKVDRRSITDVRVQRIVETHPDLSSPEKKDDPLFLYTRVLREGNKFSSFQEIGGIVIPGTEETWDEDKLPWLALRYTSIDGEDYGRGFIEEYRGDLVAYEQMSRDMKFASGNAAKVVWAIDPASQLKPKKFIEARNGGAVVARENEVNAIRLDKGGDMSVAHQQLVHLANAISADFMLNSSFQRTQERVTAEEIRRMAEELEDTLGGVFSLFAQEFQLPLALLLEQGLIRRDPDFKPLPKDAVRIGVVTGLAAIGRGQDLQRLREGIDILAAVATIFPDIVSYNNAGDINLRIWTGVGVDTEGLVKTDEEVAQDQQAAMQAQSAQTLGSELARGAGGAVSNIDPNAMIESQSPQE